MTRDTCRLPGCDRPPGYEDADDPYNSARYCSIFHEVKYDHLKDDARDAARDAKPDPTPSPGREP